jgi:hypothetical protein
MLKTCKRCFSEKNLEEFGNNKKQKDGKSIYCKKCENHRAEVFRKKNRELVNNASKKWRKNNSEKYKETVERYLKKNPQMTSKERIKKYRQNPEFKEKEQSRRKEKYISNIDKEREKRRLYYQNNKIKERRKNNEWKKNKLRTDPIERLKKNLRDRIRQFLTNNNKSKRTFEIIGLDKDKFKSYIESKFVEGMSWDNYGEWHLDHKRPLCTAKSEEEILILNHYTNLQPLWAGDNIRKNRKI